MRSYNFSEPMFMKNAQKILHNYDKYCQSRLAFIVTSI